LLHVFKFLQISDLNSRLSLKVAYHHSSPTYGEWKISLSYANCPTVGVTVLPNPCTGFKAYGTCELLPQLDLLTCHKGWLTLWWRLWVPLLPGELGLALWTTS
jgi:hypothetical protein